MTTTLPHDALGLDRVVDQLESQFAQGNAAALDGLSDDIAHKLAEGSATLEDVEVYLGAISEVPVSLQPLLSRYLRSVRGWLLVRKEREQEALADATAIIESDVQSIDGWTLKAVALLNSERYPEACEAFKTAFGVVEEEPSPNQEYRKALITGWSGCALLWTLRGILQEDLPEAERGVHEYLKLKPLASEVGLLGSVITPADKKAIKRMPKVQREVFEELELMVRLLSIKNPFHRWREFTKEISKVWSADVSAVDAIREQRE